MAPTFILQKSMNTPCLSLTSQIESQTPLVFVSLRRHLPHLLVLQHLVHRCRSSKAPTVSWENVTLTAP